MFIELYTQPNQSLDKNDLYNDNAEAICQDRVKHEAWDTDARSQKLLFFGIR